jgi:hypothetical protein
MVSRDEGKTSKVIFDEIYEKISTSGLLQKLDLIKIVACGAKKNFPREIENLEKCEVLYATETIDLHELPTLCCIYEDAKSLEAHDRILYLHLKGVSGGNIHTEWRKKMLDVVVSSYSQCINFLDEGYKACGTMMLKLNVKQKLVANYSGNFWWTRAGHILMLPNPERDKILKSHGWLVEGRTNKNAYSHPSHTFRYLAEYWIFCNHFEDLDSFKCIGEVTSCL